MVVSKRNKISFQRYAHDAMIMKKMLYIRFHKKFINCIKNILNTFSTTSTTPWSWQKCIFFRSSTPTFTTPQWWKKIQFPLLLIATMFTTSWLCQKNIFRIATTFTTPWSWQKYMFSFQHYVHYILIMTRNTFFSFQFYAL